MPIQRGIVKWEGQTITVNGLGVEFDGETLARAKQELVDGEEVEFLLNNANQVVDFKKTGGGLQHQVHDSPEQ